MAKRVFDAVWRHQGSPNSIIEKHALAQISDTETIESLVDQVISTHPAQVAQFRSGKRKILRFFVGKLMKMTRGQANPTLLHQALTRRLDSNQC